MPCVQIMFQKFCINNMKKTGLKGIDTNNIFDIHKYLMKGT